MKLIFKITLLYLLITLVVFLLGGMITHQVIMREVVFEEQRFLTERLTSAIRMIEHRKLDRPFERDKIRIIPLDGQVEETPITFSDTVVMHATLQRMEPHNKLDVIKKVGDRYYSISLYDLIIEEDDISDGVNESLLKMYLLLSVVVLVLGWIASLFILKPFNATLEQIRNFSLKKNDRIVYQKSNTREFDKLNKFVEEMTDKVRSDYQSLKEFTENASHEMQTPLSITNGKLELLLESDNLSNEQVSLIISAQESIQRLSKLGKALSLLTKIENKEFESVEKVDMSELLSKLLADFKELTDLKSIKVETEIQDQVCVRMDSTLAAIMITNLIQNAIRHNNEQGMISITMTDKKLTIRNTGEALKSDPKVLFERFKKDNQSKESIGLGLAIVKKICEVSSFNISYEYQKKMHCITVIF
ncbi:twp-component sensor histidine kinase [Fulvivirga imtechensis AK7]|uniref:histidine kinase n=1 Tax=Fulvivirga imtechensis AK7 TaxID=1237149 RepID=L8JRR9_9BACT|nr:HAMP domain-containing sensor histidine kinase [Fulvivirga imtechensis]ELR70062.1 twp-component sensor histidine kinase [Fulvivirga imtechensis AK7]